MLTLDGDALDWGSQQGAGEKEDVMKFSVLVFTDSDYGTVDSVHDSFAAAESRRKEIAALWFRVCLST